MRETEPPETVVRIGNRCFALETKSELAGLVARIGEITPMALAVQTALGFVEVCRTLNSGLILSHWPEDGEPLCSVDSTLSQDVAVECLWSFANTGDEWKHAVVWRSVTWAGDEGTARSVRESIRDTVAYYKRESLDWGQQRLYWLARSAAHDLIRKSLEHKPRFGDPDASEEEEAVAAYEMELLYLRFLLPELLPSSRN